MRLGRLAAPAAVCVALALIGVGGASADPTNAPGAQTVTFICDGVPMELTLAPGSAAFTTSTSVGIGVGVVITDVATGEVVFSSTNHGFDVNKLQTVTCTHTFDGTEFAVTAFFTPATP
jgi:hypothetical protein